MERSDVVSGWRITPVCFITEKNLKQINKEIQW